MDAESYGRDLRRGLIMLAVIVLGFGLVVGMVVGIVICLAL